MLRNRRLMGAVVALLLVGAGCGGDEPAASTTSAAPVTSTTSAPSTTTSSPPATTTSVPATTTTTTEAPVAEVPPGAMLITNEDGVYVGTLDGVASQVIAASPAVVNGLIDFAIDDTAGGVVFQPGRQLYIDMGDDSIVYWIPQGTAAYRELLVPASDQSLALEDVTAQGDTQIAYYTRVEGQQSPETARQTLRSFDMTAKTVAEIAVVGGWESGSSPISVGGPTIVSNGGGEGFYWIDFFDLDGNLIESAANPIPDGEFDCVPTDCFWYADLAPDGSRVAFGKLAPDVNGFPSIPQVEVRDIATGQLVMAVTLPALAADGYIDSLDLSDDYVLINLVEEGSEYPYATIIDIASGGLTTYQAPVGGVARFLRSVPDLDGVVTWP
jgi:hypothetical protein